MEPLPYPALSVVAVTRSFAKAATRASASIAKIEEELGVKLFHR
jgi:DNA-binding transcriptional LysR family regulator